MVTRVAKRSFYAVLDCYDKQISAGMPYKKALEAKRAIESMSRVGILQAIVATPPFRVRKIF